MKDTAKKIASGDINVYEDSVQSAALSKVPALTKKEILRDKFINEIVDCLLENRGLDQNGRAHPRQKSIPVEILEIAIQRAEEAGLAKGFKPYHITGHLGTYTKSAYVDEVLVKKIEALLLKYNCHFIEFAAKVTSTDLKSPLIEIINGHSISVNMAGIGYKFSTSPYKMLARYAEIKDIREFQEFRPYHMSTSSNGTFSDPAVVDEVLVKKIDSLLARFDGDFLKLATDIRLEDLESALLESIAGHQISVSTGSVRRSFSGSPYRMLKRYAEIKEIDEFKQFRPYHMRYASFGTYNDSTVVDEVLVKKIDSLLLRFDGNFLKLATEITSEDFQSPLIENVAGQEISVSTRMVAHRYSDSPYKMLGRYAEIKGINEFKKFRPYHMRYASFGTYNDPTVVDEVLVKKIESLLPRFDGSFIRLAAEITQGDLLSPLKDQVAGYQIFVSMHGVANIYSDSPYKMLARYAEIKDIREFQEFRPYHMSTSSNGTFSDPAVVDEVLVKKIDSLLARFDGSFIRLATEITQDDLLLPFEDEVAGHQIRVSMGGISNKFSASAYKILERYAEIRGIGEFKELRPYHMRYASNGAYNDSAVVDEVLVKKIDSLLVKYNGDLIKFALSVTSDELTSPLIEDIAGHSISTSLVMTAMNYSHSSYKMLERYAEIRGIDEFKELRPYHMNIASSGTYDDFAMVNEVLFKKIDSLLPRFDGNFLRLATEITQADLFSPLEDRVAGYQIRVSMSGVAKRYSSSQYKLLEKYAEIKGIEEFKKVRSYHMLRATNGTYNDSTIVDEVLVKKIDSLLAKYNGDFIKLAVSVTSEELLSPIIEDIAGRTISISMGSAANKYSHSPYRMLERYSEIRGIDEFKELRPYHMRYASNRTYNDSTIVDEVLVKKIDSLLLRFDESLSKLATEITIGDLESPLVENIYGNQVFVSMHSVVIKYMSSPYRLLNRYARLRNIKFEITRSCMIGNLNTRERRISGNFNAEDLRLMKSSDGDFNARYFGLRTFNSNDKKAVREVLIEEAYKLLGEAPISYIGLEDQNLRSIRLVAEYLNLSPESSVVIERDKRTFNAMNAIKGRLPNGEGKLLRNVTLLNKSLNDGLLQIDHKFNLVNLDYVGHLTTGTLKALEILIDGKLAKRAVFAVTLQDTELAYARTKNVGLGENGARELPRLFADLAKLRGYEVRLLGILPYKGGTGKRETPMLTQYFYLSREYLE